MAPCAIVRSDAHGVGHVQYLCSTWGSILWHGCSVQLLPLLWDESPVATWKYALLCCDVACAGLSVVACGGL